MYAILSLQFVNYIVLKELDLSGNRLTATTTLITLPPSPDFYKLVLSYNQLETIEIRPSPTLKAPLSYFKVSSVRDATAKKHSE